MKHGLEDKALELDPGAAGVDQEANPDAGGFQLVLNIQAASPSAFNLCSIRGQELRGMVQPRMEHG
jgi:hypothetical protein